LHVAHFSSYGPDDGQKVDRNMLSYWTYIRHPVIGTQHLLCLTVVLNKLVHIKQRSLIILLETFFLTIGIFKEISENITYYIFTF